MKAIAAFLAESNRIEGYDIPEEQYVAALEGKDAESGIVGNSVWAYQWVLENHGNPLTVTDMLTTHKRQMLGLMANKDVGAFRTGQVFIGAHVPPSAAALCYHVDSYLRNFNASPLEYDAMKLHFQYEHIHPHFDGNGRVGRLLWAWDVLRRGENIRPILDEFDSCVSGAGFLERRSNYYDALSAYHGEE